MGGGSFCIITGSTMARAPQETDFAVSVEGIGVFTFAKRTMRDEIDLQVEYARIIDGVQPTEWLEVVANWLAVFRTLTVRAPKDWDLDGLDPLDNETYARMSTVYEALRDKERSFRRKPTESSAADGAGAA